MSTTLQVPRDYQTSLYDGSIDRQKDKERRSSRKIMQQRQQQLLSTGNIWQPV